MLSFMFLNLKTPIANALSSLLPMPSQKLSIYMLVRQFLLEKQFLKNSSVYCSGFYSSILLCKITFIFWSSHIRCFDFSQVIQTDILCLSLELRLNSLQLSPLFLPLAETKWVRKDPIS